jgi:signal peptide peptidase SppA
MKLTHRLLTDAPLIEGGALSALLHDFQVSASRLACLSETQAAEHPFHRLLREKMKPQMSVREDGIAVVPVEGVLARKPDVFELFYGVEDSSNVLDMVESAARNPDVRGVLLAVDSPGGFLTGGPEIADAVKATGKQKPVVAWVGGTMASLAYYIGSQASQVVASRSAQVGSIGVFTTHVDYTKLLESAGIKIEVIKNKEADFKAAGIMGTALSDEQRTHIQERIQTSFKDFKRAVKAARPRIEDNAMRGQVFSGIEAKAAGLVDRVGDMSFAASVLRSAIKVRCK